MKPVGDALAIRATAQPPADPLARAKHVAQQFEGVFVDQLLKVMRETVPQDGELSGGAGEDMFTSLFDEHVAGEVPQQWHRGVGDAIIARLGHSAHRAPGGSGSPAPLHPPGPDAP